MLDKSRLTPRRLVKELNSHEEIAKFDALAEEWRDPQGKFKHVLAFNLTRLNAIQMMIAEYFKRDLTQDIPFNDLTILDIGCGVGLLCEPLSKQGAHVTGIDASCYNIDLARQHAEKNDININYQHCLAEDLLTKQPTDIVCNESDRIGAKHYDVVLNTEVIEHVEDQQALIKTCCELVKPGGILIMATLNRTIKSYVIGIIGAEYVMRYLPIGTHDWHYFVTPKEINTMISANGLTPITSQGMGFNPFTKQWKITSNTDVNYLSYAYKPE
ncbi:bifunctional 2-polyprenyl-6-hydroxyphenol methylase/3-demethylubiquinol 3-O-methyltransferase UbiG [Shewanella woodyi]|uniref:bifunctional 2-polyprenyl-6-hydroxyphenol methylase/3-demethylubiquinol 3-O-methyltransferase UbiG n=1 Tax=Shewanella woodyi TaxID=60961 RepID=UPI0037496BA7